MNMFKMVKFEPTPGMQKVYKDAFAKDNTINYTQFQELFKLKMAKDTKIQNKNCFRLLSGEFTSETRIEKNRIVDILIEEGYSDEDIRYLTNLLPADKDNMIDIE